MAAGAAPRRPLRRPAPHRRHLRAAGRDDAGRRAGGGTAAAGQHPGAVLRPRDRAGDDPSRRAPGDRLRQLRARADSAHLLHRAAAGIHAAGDLQRGGAREAGLPGRGASRPGPGGHAEARPAGQRASGAMKSGKQREGQGSALDPPGGFAPWTPSKGRAFAIHPFGMVGREGGPRRGVRARPAMAGPARAPRHGPPSRPTIPSEGFQGLRPWRESRGQRPLVGVQGQSPWPSLAHWVARAMTALAIDVHDLVKSFGAVKVVDGLSMQVPEGEICGFLGGNGSGKTTTIRMLCGLLRPDAGGGTCLGFDLLREPMRIREQIGYMTQRFSFYDDLTVAQNLEFVARLYQLPERDRAIAEVLQRMEMTGARRAVGARAVGRLEAAPGARRLRAAPASPAAAGRADRRRGRPGAARVLGPDPRDVGRRHDRAGFHPLHGRGRALQTRGVSRGRQAGGAGHGGRGGARRRT